MARDEQHDVAIIGAGPVGLVAAALLGQAGVDVVVVERYPDPFGLPRAIRMDHEAMRIWQELGIAEELLVDALPVERYEWFGADGEPIVAFDMPPAPSGWVFSYTFFQPELEAALERLVARLPTVQTRRGVACTGLVEHDDHVAIELRPFDVAANAPDVAAAPEPLRARYLIGADGARSTVRGLLGIPLNDAGFGERWFVIDLLPRDAGVAARLPDFPMQFCEPARPHMMGPNGRRHRRWEFMLIENEDAADYERPDHIWALLDPWLAPDEATIVRGAVYEFRAAVAESFQSGRRCFLIGDAAHRMPPHLGEGMCSGLRDAKALAWRLELVLRGSAGVSLLDSYTSERLPHAQALVDQSLAMGKVSCERDPVAAAQRDRALRAAGGVEPWPFPALGPGLGHVDEGISPSLVGQLSVQGMVERFGRSGRFDDVVGRGFSLIIDDGSGEGLAPGTRAAFEAIGGRIAALGANVSDADGALTAWLQAHGAAAVLVRPDFYVFGAVARVADVAALVDDLLGQVHANGATEQHPIRNTEENHVHH
jgi:2-polyprenyl-6-methoxyphenol hydroxylase-like FAD-dependent oxidoreductase